MCCVATIGARAKNLGAATPTDFYSAFALLAVARKANRCNRQDRSVCLSVCLSVRPSVTFDTIVRSSQSGSTVNAQINFNDTQFV